MGEHIDVHGLNGVNGVSLCWIEVSAFCEVCAFTVRSHFDANLALFALRDSPFENESFFCSAFRAVTAAVFWWTEDSKQSILERINCDVRRLTLLVFWRIWR